MSYDEDDGSNNSLICRPVTFIKLICPRIYARTHAHRGFAESLKVNKHIKFLSSERWKLYETIYCNEEQASISALLTFHCTKLYGILAHPIHPHNTMTSNVHARVHAHCCYALFSQCRRWLSFLFSYHLSD